MHPWILGGVGIHGWAAVIDGFGAQFVVPGFVAVDLAQPILGAMFRQPRRGISWSDVDRVLPTRVQTSSRWPPIGQLPLLSHTGRWPREAVDPGTPVNASRY